MKKGLKKLFAIVLAVVLVVGAFPAAGMNKVNAATSVSSINLNYSGEWPSKMGDTCPTPIKVSFSSTLGSFEFVFGSYTDSNGEIHSYNAGDTIQAGKNTCFFYITPRSEFEYSNSLEIKITDTKNNTVSYTGIYDKDKSDVMMSAGFNVLIYTVADPSTDSISINYTGGTISYNAGEKVPVCIKDLSNNITNYTMSNSSLFTFDGVTWVNRSKNLNYNDGEKFAAGDKVRIIISLIRKNSSYEFPEDLSISFNGVKSDWEYLNSTGNTAKYSKDIEIPGGSSPTSAPTATPAPNPTAAPTAIPAPTATPTPASKLPSGAENAKLVGHEDYMKYPKYSDTPTFFKFVLTATSDIEISQGISDKDEYKLYDENGKLIESFTEQDLDSKRKKKIEGLAPGTYYLGIRGTSKNNAGSMVGDKLSIYAVAGNTDVSGAETMELPIEDGTASAKWQQTGNGGSKNKMYYKLVVKDKTWYNFQDSDGVTGALYKGEKEEGDSLLTSSELNSNFNGDILLEKGTYLLVVYGPHVGNEYKVVINSRDFKDIKSITVKDYYEVYLNSKTQIPLSFSPADFESTIKWSSAADKPVEITNYDYESKSTLDLTKAIIYANRLGKYSATITTSEGISKTINVMVKPHPTKVSAATAVTKNKKKATITLEWDGDANWYRVYQKGAKDKDFKVVKETSAKTVTLSVKPDQKFTYKIDSCYKKGNEIICNSLGEGVAAMTAPAKAPTIKSAKQKGKTKYTKPYTKRYKHWLTKVAWEWEVLHLGDISTAKVKVNIKKVKGSSGIEAKKTAHGTTVITKGITEYTYKGKIGKKTEKLTVRSVWKKGVCTAYGPWSKTKKVKIKGNK